VSGQTRTEVKDKLKARHSDLDAGVRSAAGYTVDRAVADWLDEGLPGRTAKTVEANRDSLRPLMAVIGTIPLKDLTVQDVRTTLKKMAATHATRTLQKAHKCLTRALRHAEGQDLVRRNVSALVDTPRGLEGRWSQSLTLAEAGALLEAAESSRLHAFIVLWLFKLVPLLTDPLAHSTASTDALSVVVLSLPGFGFSGPPPTGGLTHHQVAEMVHQHLSILVAGQ